MEMFIHACKQEKTFNTEHAFMRMKWGFYGSRSITKAKQVN